MYSTFLSEALLQKDLCIKFNILKLKSKPSIKEIIINISCKNAEARKVFFLSYLSFLMILTDNFPIITSGTVDKDLKNLKKVKNISGCKVLLTDDQQKFFFIDKLNYLIDLKNSSKKNIKFKFLNGNLFINLKNFNNLLFKYFFKFSRINEVQSFDIILKCNEKNNNFIYSKFFLNRLLF